MKVYKALFAGDAYDNGRVIVASETHATVLAVASNGDTYVTGEGPFEVIKHNRSVVYVGGIAYSNVEELK